MVTKVVVGVEWRWEVGLKQTEEGVGEVGEKGWCGENMGRQADNHSYRVFVIRVAGWAENSNVL